MHTMCFAALFLQANERLNLLGYFTVGRIVGVVLIFTITWLLIRYTTNFLILSVCGDRGPASQ
jgi:hypothetical protein